MTRQRSPQCRSVTPPAHGTTTPATQTAQPWADDAKDATKHVGNDKALAKFRNGNAFSVRRLD